MASDPAQIRQEDSLLYRDVDTTAPALVAAVCGSFPAGFVSAKLLRSNGRVLCISHTMVCMDILFG